MQLYQILFQEMLEIHQNVFTQFRLIHEKYVTNPIQYQKEFNLVGTQVLDIIRKYEDRLCGTTERGGYAKYSHNLSDKFWKCIRTLFPKIDFVGVEIN